MKIQQVELLLRPFARGSHLITHLIEGALPNLPKQKLLNIFIHHTSAGLTINENADPSVRVDFDHALDRIAPENHPSYTHTHEGSDDMPAHIKSTLVGASLNIPIMDNQIQLGTWQGVYLCEFRNNGGRRRLTLTAMGLG